MSEERTLVLIKPDGVARGLMGEVFSRLERKGYKITSLLMTEATEEQLRRHYAEKVNAPYFPEILEYMTSGPLVAMVVIMVAIGKMVPYVTSSTVLTVLKMPNAKLAFGLKITKNFDKLA